MHTHSLGSSINKLFIYIASFIIMEYLYDSAGAHFPTLWKLILASPFASISRVVSLYHPVISDVNPFLARFCSAATAARAKRGRAALSSCTPLASPPPRRRCANSAVEHGQTHSLIRLPWTASHDSNFLTHLAQGVVNKAFVSLFKCISLFERDVQSKRQKNF